MTPEHVGILLETRIEAALIRYRSETGRNARIEQVDRDVAEDGVTLVATAFLDDGHAVVASISAAELAPRGAHECCEAPDR
jgi:hypothetical protein